MRGCMRRSARRATPSATAPARSAPGDPRSTATPAIPRRSRRSPGSPGSAGGPRRPTSCSAARCASPRTSMRRVTSRRASTSARSAGPTPSGAPRRWPASCASSRHARRASSRPSRRREASRAWRAGSPGTGRCWRCSRDAVAACRTSRAMPQSIPRWASIGPRRCGGTCSAGLTRRDWWRRCKPSRIPRGAARWAARRCTTPRSSRSPPAMRRRPGDGWRAC